MGYNEKSDPLECDPQCRRQVINLIEKGPLRGTHSDPGFQRAKPKGTKKVVVLESKLQECRE